MTHLNPDRCWHDVSTRNAAADGDFVYAVRSTGIYCRPSCPARRPRRDRVAFFPLPEAAEQAGFRPCRRCKPQDVTATDPQVAMVRHICRYIDDSAETPSLAELGEQAGCSPYHLQRVFKRLVGLTPRQYAESLRLRRLQAHLRDGDSVTNAMYAAGYGSSSRLYADGPAPLGMTPATYRRGGAGAEIGYATFACPLGRLLVAATAHGVCGVSLGDDDNELVASLAAEFPAATLHPDADRLGAWADPILRFLAGELPHVDLPLDVQATAFQWRVWQELRRIPLGSTCTYSEVAVAIGQPDAARAVARACATNPVALVVPCHRVVRGDGGLAGYRWGVARKEALLRREAESKVPTDGQEQSPSETLAQAQR